MYDPRKAIEEANKKQNDDKLGASKSSFPEGLINKSSRGRSVTGKPKTVE